MRLVPHAVAGAGARIAAPYARDARTRGAPSFAAGAISGTGAQVDAMDLGIGFRTLYAIYPTLADPVGKCGIRRIEPAGLADFSGRNVERMAVHDYIPRGT